MIGEKYGYLTIVGDAGSDKYHIRQVKCMCVCGKEKTVAYSSLKAGKVKSCGCKRAELRGDVNIRKEKRELTYELVKEKIEEIKEGLKPIAGKTPDVLTKAEHIQYYTHTFAICVLQDLIGEEGE